MRRALTQEEIGAFRARLGAAAERAFAERGTEGVTLREIARAVGVSAMTPYRYFRNKEEILAYVRAAAFDRFSERMEKAHATAGAAGRKGRAVGEAYLAFALEEPDAYRLMFDLSQPDEESYPDLRHARARATRTMTSYMEDLVAEGRLAGDPKKLGLVYWAAVHGLVNLYMAGKIGDEGALREAHATMMRTLTRGARPAPPPARRDARAGSTRRQTFT
jgi:AcrR family transcriptional regulator